MTRASQSLTGSPKSSMFCFFTTTFYLLFSSTYAGQQGDRIVCPRVASTSMSQTLDADDPLKKDFYEVSGLGFSPTQLGPSGKPILYAINDGGNRRIGVWDSGTGERLLILRMPRSMPMAQDKEAMTVGSCGIDGESSTCIYVLDVGDNTARGAGGASSGRSRDAYPIWKIREPNIGEYENNDILNDTMVSTLNFNYFDSSSPTQYADCEAAFLDHTGWGGGAVGDLYLLTKWDYDSTLVRLFKIPADAWQQANADENFVALPKAVGTYDNGLDSNALMGYMWTRAEMSFDGTVIALGDYDDQYLYLRCPGMSVADTLAVPGTRYCETWPIEYWDSQFETIAWSPDGSTLEVSECYGDSCPPPMVWTAMDYTFDATNGNGTCPASAETETSPTVAPSSPPTVSAIGTDDQDATLSTAAPNGADDQEAPPPTAATVEEQMTLSPTSQAPPLLEEGSFDTSGSRSTFVLRRAVHVAIGVVALWVTL